jgi:hypothetical protein
MINVSFDVAKVQFNAKPVLSAKDRGTMRALKKAGAFVRSDARRSMRKRGKPAPPGKPPRVVKGQLKQFLFFVVDRAESVTIGPIKLREGGAPALLEYGGAKNVRRRLRGRRESVRVDYEPHPYMNPALEQVAPKVPDLFKNAFK